MTHATATAQALATIEEVGAETPREALRRTNRKRPMLYPDGIVYVIQEREEGEMPGPVKIGWTTISPEERRRALQTGNPRRLVLRGFFPGGKGVEEQLLARFPKQRIGASEWFRWRGELAWALEDLLAAAETGDERTLRRALAKLDVFYPDALCVPPEE